MHGHEYPLNDVLEQNPKVFRLGVRSVQLESQYQTLKESISRTCGKEGQKGPKPECICTGKSHLQEPLLSYQ